MRSINREAASRHRKGGNRPLSVLMLMFAALLMQGCQVIYKTTGDVLVSYSEDEMVPYLMESSDTVMACATGESLTPLLMSFEAVGSHPQKLGVLVNVVAGSCAEQRSVEAELEYLRALEQGNVALAQDARIRQKRFARLAAKRQFKAFQLAIAQYGEPEEGVCPRLRSEFDGLVWMFGQLGGVQALLNDATAEGSVGVPRNIAPRAERGVACMDNDKWWGLPMGIRAALWNTLPMLKPEGKNAWATMEKSVDQGFENGIRLASALYAIAAEGKGDQQRMRNAIRDFANREFEVNEQYRMLDAMAKTLITNTSDRMWTRATGKRTPLGQLGTFWDDEQPGSDLNIDDLL